MHSPADYLISVKSVLVGASFVLLAETAGANETSKNFAVTVTARATTECLSVSISADGFIVARREALVFPELEGLRIAEVLAAEGDNVVAGQELVRLKRPSGESGSGASAEVLHAPTSGVVIEKTAIVGETASARATPLFRIAVNGEIEFAAEVLSIHLPQLSPRQTARILLYDHHDLNGRVRSIPAEVDPQTQLGRVRITVDSDPAVRVGTFGRATIDTDRRCNVVAVPRSAVLGRNGETTVQVIRDGSVETRHVRLGIESESRTEIREGVIEGDLIVAHGDTSLQDGDKVKTTADEDGLAGTR